MKAAALKQVTYDPSIFDIETVDEAVRIIVTPEAGLTSQHRWDVETRYLMTLIERWLKPKSDVLDYGCGIGRLAKPLIEKHGCRVIGVDISPNMRALAASCVDSNEFAALPPQFIYRLAGSSFNFALAVWTLQHVLDPRRVISEIQTMLCDGGKLFVVNNIGRVVPTTGGWINDGIDIRAVLKDQLTELEHGKLEGDDVAPGTFRDNTFWAVYQK
jgi:2-polyprenyl-3-methyl-5-hydroxy-6-metoxy-1,4-benzoquinol methylase